MLSNRCYFGRMVSQHHMMNRDRDPSSTGIEDLRVRSPGIDRAGSAPVGAKPILWRWWLVAALLSLAVWALVFALLT